MHKMVTVFGSSWKFNKSIGVSIFYENSLKIISIKMTKTKYTVLKVYKKMCLNVLKNVLNTMRCGKDLDKFV